MPQPSPSSQPAHPRAAARRTTRRLHGLPTSAASQRILVHGIPTSAWPACSRPASRRGSCQPQGIQPAGGDLASRRGCCQHLQMPTSAWTGSASRPGSARSASSPCTGEHGTNRARGREGARSLPPPFEEVAPSGEHRVRIKRSWRQFEILWYARFGGIKSGTLNSVRLIRGSTVQGLQPDHCLVMACSVRLIRHGVGSGECSELYGVALESTRECFHSRGCASRWPIRD